MYQALDHIRTIPQSFRAKDALTDPENDVYGASVYAEYQAGYPNWIASAGVVPVIDSARTTCTRSRS